MVAQSEPVDITGWSVISAVGLGKEAFTAGFREGRAARVPVAGLFGGSFPFAEACVVADFDAVKFLGPKGLKFMSRTTKFVTVASGMALADSRLAVTDENRTRIGLAGGTSVGSPKNLAALLRDTLVQDIPHMVNPMSVPHAIFNGATSQAAIWHKLKGVNATISGGRLAGLQSLNYARACILLGYADVMVAGSAEEFCEETAWCFHRAGRLGPDMPLGEGCAMFTLENPRLAREAGREALAQVLSCEMGVYTPVDGRDVQAEGLAACVRGAMARAGVSAEQVWAVSGHHLPGEDLGEVEARGLRLALGAHEPAHHVVIRRLLGECFSAAGALQVAAALALLSGESEPAGRVVLVTSVAHSGAVGCAVLRGGRG